MRGRFTARLIAALSAASLLGCLGGDDTPDPEDDDEGGLSIVIEPAMVVARHHESVTLRVDTPESPERNLPAGYAFDLDEVVGDINVTTAPCPTGVGTRACQEWTITPGARSVPGIYDVHVRTVGTRVGVDSAYFELRVLLASTPDHGAAVRVAASSTDGHVLVLNDAGQVFAMGDNHNAESRLGYRRQPVPGLDYGSSGIEIYEPAEITEFVAASLPADVWTQIAATPGSSYAVRSDGTAWAWGSNPEGAFGFNTSSQSVLFAQQIPGLTNVRALLPGRVSIDASFALLNDGSVQFWQAGFRPRQALCEELTDTQCLRYFTGVQAMTGSPSGVPYGHDDYPPWGFGLLLKDDGSVWDSGPTPGRIVEPRTVAAFAQDGDLNLWLAGRDGTVWMKPPDGEPVLKQGLADIDAISTRPDHERDSQDVFALRGDRTVWAWNEHDPSTQTPQQVRGLANVVSLGAHYAITDDCGNGGGALWRIDFPRRGGPRAVRIPGFGAGQGCTPGFTEQLVVSVIGQGRVISSPTGIDCELLCNWGFPRGTELKLHAIPDTDWVFDQWEGDTCQVIQRGEPTSIVLGQVSNCQATFLPRNERLLKVQTDSDGRVTSEPAGIDCGTDCSEWFSKGSLVRLTAHPALGFRFMSFAGHSDCADGNVTMDNVISCFAQFRSFPPPAAPTGFAGSAMPIAVQLRWDGVNGPVARYALERADGSGVYVPVDLNIVGTASTFTDGSATPNTTYTYRLMAINAVGPSFPVTTVVTTGMLPVPPQQGWSELGNALSTTAEGPQSPSIAVDANGLPTVAYVEPTSNIGRLFVRRFDGTAWQILGGSSLNPTSGTGVSDPSLVLGLDGNPRVAFSQGNRQQQNIYVAAFNGVEWSSLGSGAPLNQAAGSIAIRPSLARTDGGRFSVAWIEDGTVLVKTNNGAQPIWDSYAVSGPSSANVDAVALAFAPGDEPVVAWRETANGLSALHASRGFQMQSIGIIAGPSPSAELRDFGLIVDGAGPPGTPLLAYGQGVVPWSIRLRSHAGSSWQQLPDVLTDVQTPLQAIAMHRSAVNQGIAYTWQSGGSDSGLVTYRREQGGWVPASPVLALGSSSQLSLAMTANASPIVAVVEQVSGTYRLRVFRYVP